MLLGRILSQEKGLSGIMCAVTQRGGGHACAVTQRGGGHACAVTQRGGGHACAVTQIERRWHVLSLPVTEETPQSLQVATVQPNLGVPILRVAVNGKTSLVKVKCKNSSGGGGLAQKNPPSSFLSHNNRKTEVSGKIVMIVLVSPLMLWFMNVCLLPMITFFKTLVSEPMVKTSATKATPTEYALSLLVLEATPTMSPPPLSLEVTPTKPVTSLLLEFVAIPIVVVGVALLVTVAVAVAVLLCWCVIKQQLAKKHMQLACGVPCDVDTALPPRHGGNIKVSSNVAYSHSGVAPTLPVT